MGNRFFSTNALQTTLDRLTGNPLLTALFLLSPPDALTYLGAAWLAIPFQGARATNPADQQQVQRIVQALHAGQTSLAEPQMMQPTQNVSAPDSCPDACQPDASVAPGSRSGLAPDIVVQVPEKTIQFLLARAAEKHFTNREFTVLNGTWMEARIRLLSWRVSLQPGMVHLIVGLDVTCAVLVGGWHGLRWKTPLELDIRTGVSVNAASQLCLDIGTGSIVLRNTRLPVAMAHALVEQITTALPTIPLVTVASLLPDTQDVLDGEWMLLLSHIDIDPTAITLEWQLFQSPGESPLVTVQRDQLCAACQQRIRRQQPTDAGMERRSRPLV